jgi:hypothetical protein
MTQTQAYFSQIFDSRVIELFAVVVDVVVVAAAVF